MLAETIQIGRRRQPCAQAQILRFEDERRRRGVEEYLARLGARDLEGERVALVVELESRRLVVCATRGRAREDGLGHLVHLLVGVDDLDMDSFGCGEVVN